MPDASGEYTSATVRATNGARQRCRRVPGERPRGAAGPLAGGSMRILITGGNGGVGRDLVPALLLRGHEVVVLDREVGALVPHPGLRVVRGLLEEPATVAEACRGADAIVHLAWSFS